MNIKESFSKTASNYKLYRPEYTQEIYDFILGHCKKRDHALDCATGNGQVAKVLAGHFKQVTASDISAQQLQEAITIDNVAYVESSAEKTPFANNSFDLITVAQAIHWFDFDEFYEEVHRIAKPGAWIAMWGYGLIRVGNEINGIIDNFYNETVGKYWDEARKHIETSYRSIPFPFSDLKSSTFENKKTWTVDHFLGYLGTWTSVQQYRELRGEDPIKIIEEDIRNKWGAEREIYFPIFLKMGKIK